MQRLVLLDGPEAGRKFPLAEGHRLGRLRSCEIQLVHGSISRVHALVEQRAGELWIVDQGSSNGLRVAGQKVNEVMCEDGLEFAVGGLEMRFDGGQAPSQMLDEDFDFEEVAPAPAARPAPVEQASPGLSLEDPAEIEIGEHSGAPAQSAPEPSPVAPSAPQSARDERRDQVIREVGAQPSGLLRGDLTQFPGWVQGLVWLGLLGGLGAAAWGMFSLVQSAK